MINKTTCHLFHTLHTQTTADHTLCPICNNPALSSLQRNFYQYALLSTSEIRTAPVLSTKTYKPYVHFFPFIATDHSLLFCLQKIRCRAGSANAFRARKIPYWSAVRNRYC